MGSWKIRGIGILYSLLLLFNEAKGQKKWDGEAGDGAWHSNKNWHPDGVPDSSETVILDNAILSTSYTVRLSSDTSQVRLHALIIQPLPENWIILEIPPTNRAVPAVEFLSDKQSITICKGGMLMNKSTAVAGNTVLMNGKMRIEDGGRYSHQTLRGNAYIITRIESTPGTEQGVIEFDVPGNSTYPISISGKQYGSLWLNASSREKRTYAGTGTNDLVIKGDLIIRDSVNFNSSLTGNIYIKEKLNNRGSLSLNPSSTDNLNRELIFIGDSSAYYSPGSVFLGENFRAIRLKKGSLALRSSIQVDRPTAAFIVDANARLMMDTFCVFGAGQFNSDSNAILGIGSADGISMNTSKGNIRTSQKNISPATSFIFYGDQEQATGTAFPINIAALEINKIKGGLWLSSRLFINESLKLSRGIIHSSSDHTIQLSGVTAEKEINAYGWGGGNDSSFIDGPFRLQSDNADTGYFPIGKDQIFAPMKISYGNRSKKIIEVTYNDSLQVNEHRLLSPLKSITKNGYWEVRSIDNEDKIGNTVSLQLSVRHQANQPLIHPPCAAWADSIEAEWTIAENTMYDPSSKTISCIMILKDGVITIGSTQDELLSGKRIELSCRKKDDFTILWWSIHGDVRIENMQIETSTDGVKYETHDQGNVYSAQIGEHRFEKIILRPDHPVVCFRIVAHDELRNRIVSNIACTREQNKMGYPYPNPASNELTIWLGDRYTKKIDAVEVVDGFGRILPAIITLHEDLLKINISGIPRGSFRMIISANGEKKIYPFVKN